MATLDNTFGRLQIHQMSFHTGFSTTRNVHVTEQCPIFIPTYIGNDYFCETGVPPSQAWSDRTFYADDLLWDGQDCGPASACCTFNDPPWFVNNYLSQLMPIWKSGCALLIL